MCVMRRERINLIGGNLTPRWVGARLRCVHVLLYSQVRGGELYFHLRKKVGRTASAALINDAPCPPFTSHGASITLQ
jgi:hypothetical protein